MAAGVGVALNSFWTLVNNWKTGSNSELTLKSENGRLSVTLSADLGVWEPPGPPPMKSSTSDASRGHQGPRKGAGPSRQRRRERRAAERAAESALGDLPEAVEPEETEAEEAENAYVAESTREVETTVEAETVRNAETAKEADTAVNVVPASCNICDYESETEESLKIHSGRNHQDIPQLDGETNDNVKIDCEPVEHEESNISQQCCPLCGDDTVYLKTESEFKTHILNYHEQMQVLKTFGKEWIEENTRHFFFMDKDRRKIWKNFMKRRQ